MAYIYLHTNGSLHYKRNIVVDSGGGPNRFFDSPLVQRWWRIESIYGLADIEDEWIGLEVDEDEIEKTKRYIKDDFTRGIN